jgi:hypothetical protein
LEINNTNKGVSKVVTVTCQYTGIEFEAKTRRSKNHPLVSDLLEEANKRRMPGAYNKAKALLDECQGMTDIDAIVNRVNIGLDAYDDAKNDKINKQRQDDKDRQEAQRRRQQTNAVLKLNGYRWQKVTEEDMDAFGASAFSNTYGNREHVWELIAPDGQVVTISEAMEAIN